MIVCGDLVKSIETGKIGIVTDIILDYEICYVLMHDRTYTIRTSNLKLLEKK